MKVKVIDFDANTPEFKGEVIAYKRGINDATATFNDKHTSSYFNSEIERKLGEKDTDYIKRLKNTCVELMCSNRGYASCFEKINK